MERVARAQLLALAARQDSLFTVRQAAALGITPPMLRGALGRGWINRQRRGVYVVAGAPPSPMRPVVAAALAAGADAVVSHSSAAVLHNFHGVVASGVELTLPNTYRKNHEAVTVHRSTTLLPGDVTTRRGVPVTSPIRTLIDLSDRFGDPLLGLILDEGSISRLWTADAVAARLHDSRRGSSGVAALRPLVDLRLGEGNPASKLEQRVIRVVKHLATGYVVHYRVVLDGMVIEMDIAWPALKIDGEVDGMGTRMMSRSKFEHERRRANILAAHGWRIVHFTHEMDDTALIAQLTPLF